ncbi:LON peptidase substrate-binding domain-containing protein [Oleisolibacter albus]|uniref:LON peptidase substrate-binding domain-containing protein n=1 Tax=Oleisolibacter albus TaxID=2171757 RepID=UPI000DF2FCFD|nr:LON peptidase substrate-binding domain-containing protein [Oleisolibacter albus]
MSPNPFDPTFDQLPHSIPVFPLTGVLLLPRGKLPLNIFEPRYLAMTRDALAGDRMIGMIQPMPREGAGPPSLYPMGCAGRITSFTETEDGRFLVTLTGVCRFRPGLELATTRGYRRVVPDWGGFEADLEETDGGIDRPRLLAGLKAYFRQQDISANWDAIGEAPDERLVTSLSMICPFEPPEKQALLEAPDLPTRAKMLLALIEMAVHDKGGGDPCCH